jgi:transposase-like protein
MPSPFEDETTAREVLEALRWPDGPRCPRCGSGGPEVFLIGGEKRSHREGLYQCKPCRRQFSVTVGTPLERLRIPLSTWVRAAREFSYEGPAYGKGGKPSLLEIQSEIDVSYRTVLRMRDIIKRAARKYRGHKKGFGAWPRSFMVHKSGDHAPNVRRRLLAEGKHPSQHTIQSSGVLRGFVTARASARHALDRTECLLMLLLGALPKRQASRKRRLLSREWVAIGAKSLKAQRNLHGRRLVDV